MSDPVTILLIEPSDEDTLIYAEPDSNIYKAHKNADVVVVREGPNRTVARVIKGELSKDDLAKIEKRWFYELIDNTDSAKTEPIRDRNEGSALSGGEEGARRGTDPEARSFTEPAMERGLRKAENNPGHFDAWLAERYPVEERVDFLKTTGLMSQRRFSEVSFEDRMAAGRLLAQYGAEPAVPRIAPMPTAGEVHDLILHATNEDEVGEVTESSIADRVFKFILERWPDPAARSEVLSSASTAWVPKVRTASEVFADTFRALVHWRNEKIGRSYRFMQNRQNAGPHRIWDVALFQPGHEPRHASGDVLAYVMDELFPSDEDISFAPETTRILFRTADEEIDSANLMADEADARGAAGRALMEQHFRDKEAMNSAHTAAYVSDNAALEAMMQDIASRRDDPWFVGMVDKLLRMEKPVFDRLAQSETNSADKQTVGEAWSILAGWAGAHPSRGFEIGYYPNDEFDRPWSITLIVNERWCDDDAENDIVALAKRLVIENKRAGL